MDRRGNETQSDFSLLKECRLSPERFRRLGQRGHHHVQRLLFVTDSLTEEH